MKKRPVGKFLRFLHGLSVFLCNIHKIEKNLDKGIFLCYNGEKRKRGMPYAERTCFFGDRG